MPSVTKRCSLRASWSSCVRAKAANDAVRYRRHILRTSNVTPSCLFGLAAALSRSQAISIGKLYAQKYARPRALNGMLQRKVPSCPRCLSTTGIWLDSAVGKKKPNRYAVGAVRKIRAMSGFSPFYVISGADHRPRARICQKNAPPPNGVLKFSVAFPPMVHEVLIAPDVSERPGRIPPRICASPRLLTSR
jgi:hypothetical protein